MSDDGRRRVLVATDEPALTARIVDALNELGRYEVAVAVRSSAVATEAATVGADVVLAGTSVAAVVPSTLAGRVVVVASAEDGWDAQETARRIGAAGWAPAESVARQLERIAPSARPSLRARLVSWPVALALLAVVVRAAYFAAGRLEPPFTGWYIDSFHHWQIAYLSKEIGFANGPRLWDLGGMEYFWGAVPALLGALALAFTPRIEALQVLNLLAGSASVGVLYLVGRRYWSHRVGLLIAAFVALNPVSVLVDTSAMQEPIAFLFLALGLYWFLDRPVVAGVALGLAAASRPDYWLYTLALLATAFVAKGRRPWRPAFAGVAPLVLGYALALTPYVAHLWLQTGDPLYPLTWNFFGNVRGSWMPDVQATPHQLAVQAASRVLLAAALAGQLVVISLRPQGWPVLSAGLWGAALIGFMLGVSRYILGYLDRFWFDRIMLLLYLLVATLAAVALVRLEARLGLRRIALGTALGLAGVCALSALWLPIRAYEAETRGFSADLAYGAEVAALAREGGIVVPGDAVGVTYALVQHGTAARRLVSALYHPDYTPGTRDDFFAWLRRYDVRWLAVHRGDQFYGQVIAAEPAHFTLVTSGVLDLYAVRP